MTQTNTQNAPNAVSDRVMAAAIRALSMDAVQQANSGHPGMPMGMADVATVLFTRFMKFDPKAPHWPDRDRFVLSAGHGSMLLYSLLHLTGYEEMTMDQLRRFRQLGSITAGHPEYGHAEGIETTTGPLGQGLATSVGMAIAEKLLANRFGADLVDHYTYVIAGDGCLQEGVSHEAIDMAGHLKLSKLIVLWDDNAISIDGATSLSTSTDQIARFAASGWATAAVDGHDAEAVAKAIEAARKSDRPTFIACKTKIGWGAPNKAGTHKVHGEALGHEEVAAARVFLEWPHEPFVVPEPVLSAWRAAGSKGTVRRKAWEQRLAAAPAETRTKFQSGQDSHVTEAASKAVLALKEKWASEKPKLATRQASQKSLEALIPAVPELLGGSADLTGSVLTRVGSHKSVSPDDFSGDYLHYGIREFGMAAAMNGIALHRGFIPYGGTFLVFADYARPAIRLAALMGVRVIHVLTHDSIGLGEDGPTHQPVETLSSLRVIPNMTVIRPADAIETAEAWEAAIANEKGPTGLSLTRQALPALRLEHTAENMVLKGAYILRKADGAAKVTLMGSGSEVSLAVAAAESLAAEGIAANVVSVPSMELFMKQSPEYRKSVLGTAPRIAVEAALQQSWDRFLRDDDVFIGMTGFGASAPAPDLYRHFGITAEAIVDAARKLAG
ncbi:MAG: transketolase [Bauldia sp.]|nr:transketolase [Bauldia sp.]